MFERILAQLEDKDILWNTINTAALVLTVLVARALILRSLRARLRDNAAEYRRVRSLVRNLALAFTLVAGAVVWANELKTLALSLVAVAAAVVIATKELILCVSGAFYRSSAHLFDLGDRIEVAGVRGDVVELGLLSTVVMEVGPKGAHHHTGRAVTVPNAVLLAQPVINETYTQSFVLQTFTVPVEDAARTLDVERALLDAAVVETREHVEAARAHFAKISSERGVERVTVEPKSWVSVVDGGKTAVVVRFPAPARRRGAIEQAILRRALPALSAPEGDRSSSSAADS